MKTNFRELFINTLQGIEDLGLDELAKFAVADPLPCWGAFYKKFATLNLKFETLQILIERWIALKEGGRFLLLLIKQRYQDHKIMSFLAKSWQRLPEIVQVYMAILPAGRKTLADKNDPVCQKLLENFSNPITAWREQQIIEARINKILRFDWAPQEQNTINHYNHKEN